jgi:membrane protease YdiL (CAAX protease family)
LIFPAALTVIQFFSLWLLLWLPIAIPMALKVGWRPFQPSQPAQKLPLLALLYLLAPLALWLVGCLNLQSLSPKFWGELGIGLLVGAVSLLASFGMQLRIGWLQMDTSLTLKLPDALFLLVLSLWIGWTEELVFRGFMQDQLQQELPIWVAAALISLWFAALHGLWDGREVVPQLPGLWLMGMVLVLARQTADGDLSLAWGLHSGWVWAIGTLDGAMRSSGRHPDWLTGLNDRPLAGFMGLLFLLITAGGLWWVMRLA